ncbi:MAG TPA: 6-phosphogluconolactonase [Acidimicrobiia bacterium]|jgi:6-phosphogluconolactonase|nr:6-phosphogluconolactonase [Acidimicrobiia bacterium]
MSRALPIHVGTDADDAAQQAAELIAADLATAIAQRGRASIAFSGGTTPWPMVRALATSKIAWDKVDVFQVDERVAPAGDPDRNATHLQSNLIGRSSIPKRNWHPIPVEEPDPAGAARNYERTLREVAGEALDVVHLGLGPDGHTASLVPGDPVLGETERLVAATGPYQGHRRVTLTYPALDAARRIVWFETGAAKGEILRRLVAGDPTIPAGRVLQDRAVVVCDEPAAALLLDGR